jgi:hypothetical protein
MASASAPGWVRLALAWPVLNRQIGPPPYTLRTMTPQVISGTMTDKPAPPPPRPPLQLPPNCVDRTASPRRCA